MDVRFFVDGEIELIIKRERFGEEGYLIRGRVGRECVLMMFYWIIVLKVIMIVFFVFFFILLVEFDNVNVFIVIYI